MPNNREIIVLKKEQKRKKSGVFFFSGKLTVSGKISSGGAAISVTAMRQIANLWFLMSSHSNVSRTLNTWNTSNAVWTWIAFFEKIRIDYEKKK